MEEAENDSREEENSANVGATLEEMENYRPSDTSDDEDEEENKGNDKEPNEPEERSQNSIAPSSLNRPLHQSCGKIIKIQLVDFMCHKNLHVDLGDRINFITGQNGTGKSVRDI